MEPSARAAMAHLPLKPSERVELHRALHRFIASAYSLAQADEHRDACAELNALRERVRQATFNETNASELMTLFARYYRLLTALSTRFGGAVEDTDTKVTFVWRDAFKNGDKAMSSELKFERACVVFNLAAAISYAGTLQNRNEAEGLRDACQLFQQAAGALDQLQGLLAELPSTVALTTDLHPKSISAWRSLMLAQAQQCYYEKATKDKMKAAVVSKLAAQVSLMCSEAVASLRSKELKTHFDKWTSTAEWNQKLFDALAHFHMAEHHEREYEYGSQVSRLEYATSQLSELVRQSRNAPPERQASYSEALTKVSTAMQQAVKLNSTVYHERVPMVSSLPPIVPKSIVKPVAVAELKSSRSASDNGDGDDLFAKLVPLTVLREASIYTARRDEMLREMAETAQMANQMAEAEMAGMDLPHALQACTEDERIPKSLVEQIVRAQQTGGEEFIVQSLMSLAQRGKDMQALCMSIDVLLEVDEGADLQLQQAHGAKWRCLRSNQLTADLREELSDLRGQVNEASTADHELEMAYNSRRALLEALQFPLDVLNEQVPRSEASLAQLQCTQDCASLVESIGTLMKARDAVLLEARAKASKDDITQELVYRGDEAGGSNEQVFIEALQRYSPLCERLSDSVKQQDELLSALRDANEAFIRARFEDPLLERRSEYFRSLHNAVCAFSELETHLLSGMTFYEEMTAALENLHRRVVDLNNARAIERSELLQEIERSANARVMDTASESVKAVPPGAAPSSSTQSFPMEGPAYPPDYDEQLAWALKESLRESSAHAPSSPVLNSSLPTTSSNPISRKTATNISPSVPVPAVPSITPPEMSNTPRANPALAVPPITPPQRNSTPHATAQVLLPMPNASNAPGAEAAMAVPPITTPQTSYAPRATPLAVPPIAMPEASNTPSATPPLASQPITTLRASNTPPATPPPTVPPVTTPRVSNAPLTSPLPAPPITAPGITAPSVVPPASMTAAMTSTSALNTPPARPPSVASFNDNFSAGIATTASPSSSVLKGSGNVTSTNDFQTGLYHPPLAPQNDYRPPDAPQHPALANTPALHAAPSVPKANGSRFPPPAAFPRPPSGPNMFQSPSRAEFTDVAMAPTSSPRSPGLPPAPPFPEMHPPPLIPPIHASMVAPQRFELMPSASTPVMVLPVPPPPISHSWSPLPPQSTSAPQSNASPGSTATPHPPLSTPQSSQLKPPPPPPLAPPVYAPAPLPPSYDAGSVAQYGAAVSGHILPPPGRASVSPPGGVGLHAPPGFGAVPPPPGGSGVGAIAPVCPPTRAVAQNIMTSVFAPPAVKWS